MTNQLLGKQAWYREIKEIFYEPSSLDTSQFETPPIGVAIGTAGTTAFKLGLLTKIGGSTDVKAITWTTQNVVTTLNGGTIGSFVDTTNHAFSGSSIMAGTEAYKAYVVPTWDNKGKTNLAA